MTVYNSAYFVRRAFEHLGQPPVNQAATPESQLMCEMAARIAKLTRIVERQAERIAELERLHQAHHGPVGSTYERPHPEADAEDRAIAKEMERQEREWLPEVCSIPDCGCTGYAHP